MAFSIFAGIDDVVENRILLFQPLSFPFDFFPFPQLRYDEPLLMCFDIDFSHFFDDEFRLYQRFFLFFPVDTEPLQLVLVQGELSRGFKASPK